MKTKLANSRIFSFKITFFTLILLIVSLSGCGKMKEDFQRGMEKGRREAGKGEQAPTPVPVVMTTLAAENLENDRATDLDHLVWKYHPGDDLSWATPEFDDSAWEAVTPRDITNFTLPKSGWNGIGWFRLRIKIDETLVGQPLSLEVNHPGASEIYADGKLVRNFGKVAADKAGEETYNPGFIPTAITFAQAGEHIIALRYSNTDSVNFSFKPLIFQLRVSSLNPKINSIVSEASLKNGIKGGIFGICLALGLLHLLLFILYPQQLGNLFYSLFLFAEAASVVFVEIFFANLGESAFFAKILFGMLAGAVYYLAFTAYLYTVLEKRIPRYVRIMALLWALVLVLVFISSLAINTILTFACFLIGFLLFLVLMLWHIVTISIIIVRAISRKVDNSWVLGIVGISFIASAVSSSVLVVAFGENSAYFSISEFACLTLLIVANAAFLARQFARTSKNLEQQLIKEVDYEKEKARLAIVEAENSRRAEELEEARQLQISMLPKKLPELPNLEIAAYMKPATEVGGDYYDFHVAEDGTLTVAIGDATGHGLKAGTMVSVTKGLFNNLAHAPEISEILNQMSRSLKMMNLRGLFMALTLLKYRDNNLLISAAGMPSALVYRAATATVEEISIRALPLGSVARFKYAQQKVSLSSGDIVLLMSDGFPEMFNEQNEMLGFDKAAEILPRIAANSPQEIINHLIEVSRQWAGARPQDDDITFVTLKII